MWSIALLASLARSGDLAVEAERALAQGRPADALALATPLRELPASDPDRAIGLLVALQAQHELGMFKSAVMTAREVMQGDAHQDRGLIEVIRVYAGLGRHDQAVNYALMVDPESPWFGEATALVAVYHPWNRARLGAAHALSQPEQVGTWFEPLAPAAEASSAAELCRLDLANAAMDGVADRLDALDRALAEAAAMGDEALWAAFSASPEWPDAGLRHRLAIDPLLARRFERAAGSGDPELRTEAVRAIRSAVDDATERMALAVPLAAAAPDQLEVARRQCEDPAPAPCGVGADALVEGKRRDGDYQHDDAGHFWYARGWRQEQKSCF